MNVFSTDRGLRALAIALGAPDAAIVLADVGRSTVRTVVVEDRPVVTHRLVDFFEPVGLGVDQLAGELRVSARYVPRLAARSVAVGDWPAVERPEFEPAPFVDWTEFADWSTFESTVTSRRKKLWADSRRSAKRLSEEAGPLEFVDDDPDPDAWRQCIAWKIDQYRRTGAPDSLSDPTSASFLDALRDQGLARLTTLRSGGRCIAAHIGLLDEGRQYYWLPAYDSTFDRHGPGRLLLHHLLRTGFERGDREFDFLLGDEPYKWWYATHARVVEGVGSPTLVDRARLYRHTMPKRHPEIRRRGQIALRSVRRIRSAVGAVRAEGGEQCS